MIMKRRPGYTRAPSKTWKSHTIDRGAPSAVEIMAVLNHCPEVAEVVLAGFRAGDGSLERLDGSDLLTLATALELVEPWIPDEQMALKARLRGLRRWLNDSCHDVPMRCQWVTIKNAVSWAWEKR